MNKIKFGIISSFLISILTYNLWGYIKLEYNISIFYTGIALSFLLYSYTISETLKYLHKKEEISIRYVIFSEIGLTACISNLIDELFFDPTKIEINEYITFLLGTVLIIIINLQFKNGNRRKRRY